jgi:hypothetical protein
MTMKQGKTVRYNNDWKGRREYEEKKKLKKSINIEKVFKND